MTVPEHTKREKAVHALLRGGVVFVGLLVLGVALAVGLFRPLTTHNLLRSAAIAAAMGLAVAAKWYWEATGGQPL